MKIPSWFNRRLKMVDPGLYAIENPRHANRYQIWWHHLGSGTRRFIYDVEDENGDPTPLDERIIIRLSQNIDWKCLHENPHPTQTYDFFQNQRKQIKDSAAKRRESDRQYRIKHYKKEFRQLRDAMAASMKENSNRNPSRKSADTMKMIREKRAAQYVG